MRRLIVGVLLAMAVAVGLVGGAAYAVNEHAPHGNQTSHAHHVHTGNGECEDIDEVKFEGDSLKGVHRAAIESGNLNGPWHLTCEAHVHP